MEQAIEKAKVLIEALPYIRSYRRKFIVIKLGGSAMTDESALRSVLTDIVFMESVDMWPVLVHGGGPRISEEMKLAGLEPRFVQGQRVTTPEVMEIVSRVLIDEISAHVCHVMDEVGGKALPLNGRTSPFLVGRKKVLLPARDDAPEVDLGLVGEVTKVDREICYRLADGGLIPVVAPVARSEETAALSARSLSHVSDPSEAAVELLNVNGDATAAAVAVGLGAEKLVVLSNVPGVMTDPKDESTLRRSLHSADVEKLIADGTIAEGMLPKVQSCLRALEGGVRKAHIVSALLPHALLLEIVTDRGIGTDIVAGLKTRAGA